VPLAGKTTQALSFTREPPRADATVQLGDGWFRFDAGTEFQGGVRLELVPGAPVPPDGAIATVQLSSQLAANGSTVWNTMLKVHAREGVGWITQEIVDPVAVMCVSTIHERAEET
jgi:hypothetical protein